MRGRESNVAVEGAGRHDVRRCTQMTVAKETVRVGIREFRENLATYLLESDTPVVVTRHGDTVGYYIPARKGRSDADREGLREVAQRLQKMLASAGITEDEIVRDFGRWRNRKRK
jgi:PHD/YefM family antitoxin component YafN of YafNO toxin-antitoxin module